jgi:hypothetical protein
MDWEHNYIDPFEVDDPYGREIETSTFNFEDDLPF